MVSDDNAGSGVEVLAAGDDVEFDAGGEAHAELEGARGQVLGEAVLADEAEDDGDDDAVGGAKDEGEVGSEEAGDERGVREEDGGAGKGEEGEGEAEVGDAEVEEDVVDIIHFGSTGEKARTNGREWLVYSECQTRVVDWAKFVTRVRSKD